MEKNITTIKKKTKKLQNKQIIVLIISFFVMCGTIVGAGFAIDAAIKKNVNSSIKK